MWGFKIGVTSCSSLVLKNQPFFLVKAERLRVKALKGELKRQKYKPHLLSPELTKGRKKAFSPASSNPIEMAVPFSCCC